MFKQRHVTDEKKSRRALCSVPNRHRPLGFQFETSKIHVHYSEDHSWPTVTGTL